MRILRRDIGMSAEAFGEFVGMSGSLVGMIERGERPLRLDAFFRICEFFGVDAEYMTKPINIPANLAEKSDVANNERDLKVRTITGMVRTFGPRELDMIIEMLRSLKVYSNTDNHELSY